MANRIKVNEKKKMKSKKALLSGIVSVCMLFGMPLTVMAEEVMGPGANLPENYTSEYNAPAALIGPGMKPQEPGEGAPEGPAYNRVDYFTEQVSNPIVPVVEKYSYDQMVQDIASLNQTYPGRMQTNVIGTTLDGRNIYELVIGNPNAPKHIMIHAGIHAREYMTPLLVMKQVEYGLHFYDRGRYADRSLSEMLQQVAIHYVPMVNPDGITISQFGTEAIRSDILRQRILDCYEADKAAGRTSATLERYLSLWKANGRGVDLNQNFPANWELVTTTQLPSYATYKGDAPLSEPESQALADLVNSRPWAVTISYHSMGNVIYWDYTGNKKQAESQQLAGLISDNTGYRLYGSSGHGGFKDWTQTMENPVPGLTIETGSVACPLPIDQFNPIWDANKMVWAEVAKYAIEH